MGALYIVELAVSSRLGVPRREHLPQDPPRVAVEDRVGVARKIGADPLLEQGQIRRPLNPGDGGLDEAVEVTPDRDRAVSAVAGGGDRVDVPAHRRSRGILVARLAELGVEP